MAWILGYFSNEDDIYGVIKAVKSQNVLEINRAFTRAYESLYSMKVNSTSNPLDYLRWLVKQPQIRDIKIKKTIGIQSYKSLSEEYNTKVKSYSKIFKQSWKFDSNLCSNIIKKLQNPSTQLKSYVINEYYLTQFNNIIDKHARDGIDNSLESALTSLESSTKKNKKKYIANDEALIEKYETDLKEFNINISNINSQIKKLHRLTSIEEFTPSCNTLQKYVDLYKNYQQFVYYSTFSLKFEISDDLKSLYSKIKILLDSFLEYRRGYMFTNLLQALYRLDELIFDKNHVPISPENWDITDDFHISVWLLEDLLIEINKYFPASRESLAYTRIALSKAIHTIADIQNKILYCPPNNEIQIFLTNKIIPERLISLLLKHTVDNSRIDIQRLLNLKTNDLEFYMHLRKYRKSYQEGGVDNRAQYRLKEITSFLPHINEYNQILRNASSRGGIEFLDFGGNDGSLSYEFGKFLNLKKEQIISADIQNLDVSKVHDVTYLTLPISGTLPFVDNFFSIITCFQVLHHIEDVIPVINELARVIKKGGILVLREHDNSTPQDKMLSDIEHCVYEVVRKDPPNISYLNTYYAWYKTRDWWIDTLNRAGFSYIQEKGFKYPYPRNNPTKYFYAAFIKQG